MEESDEEGIGFDLQFEDDDDDDGDDEEEEGNGDHDDNCNEDGDFGEVENDDDDDLLIDAVEQSTLNGHASNDQNQLFSVHGNRLSSSLMEEDEKNISFGCDTQPEQRRVSHGYEKYAGELWIYPANYPIRDYQYNIVQKALFTNTLVVLPTGLGKTFIAAVVMYNLYRWFPQGKVVFMAPTRPLVAQQINACYNIMGIPKSDTIEMTGRMHPNARVKAWREKRMIFLTPQVMTNDISRGSCRAVDIRCVVVDEAHKAMGNHAYCQVIKELVNFSSEFRVLALSATPGSDLKSVQQVVSNLLISHIELRSEDSIDIRPYTHERKVEKIVVPMGEELNEIRLKYLQIMQMVVEPLQREKLLFNRELTKLSQFVILKARDEFRMNPPEHIAPSRYGFIAADFAVAMSVYHGYELLQLHGLRSLFNYLQSIKSKDKGYGRTRSELIRCSLFNEIMESLSDKFSAPGGMGKKVGVEGKLTVGHPKIQRLEEVVVQHFTIFKEKGQDTRVMIFSQYRDSVEEIRSILAQHAPLVKVMAFIGHSSHGKLTKGYSQKEQLRVMKEFREGDFNTLVSTCVGEEGLDIGDVDLIVCFDAHASPIRLVQRMGRTGRKRAGRIVMLVTEGREERIYQQSLYSKKSIHKAILNGARTLHFYQNSPRLIPSHVTPKCHKMFITLKKEESPKKVEPPKKKGKSATTNKGKKDKRQSGSIPEMFSKQTAETRLAPSSSSSSAILDAEEYEEIKEEFSMLSTRKKCIPSVKCLTLNRTNRRNDFDFDLPDQHSSPTAAMVDFSEWMPWQNRFQKTHLIGHSSKTVHLVRDVEFIQLQQSIGEDDGEAYRNEMDLYLNKDDLLIPVNDKHRPTSSTNLNLITSFLITSEGKTDCANSEPSTSSKSCEKMSDRVKSSKRSSEKKSDRMSSSSTSSPFTRIKYILIGDKENVEADDDDVIFGNDFSITESESCSKLDHNVTKRKKKRAEKSVKKSVGPKKQSFIDFGESDLRDSRAAVTGNKSVLSDLPQSIIEDNINFEIIDDELQCETALSETVHRNNDRISGKETDDIELSENCLILEDSDDNKCIIREKDTCSRKQPLIPSPPRLEEVKDLILSLKDPLYFDCVDLSDVVADLKNFDSECYSSDPFSSTLSCKDDADTILPVHKKSSILSDRNDADSSLHEKPSTLSRKDGSNTSLHEKPSALSRKEDFDTSLHEKPSTFSHIDDADASLHKKSLALSCIDDVNTSLHKKPSILSHRYDADKSLLEKSSALRRKDDSDASLHEKSLIEDCHPDLIALSGEEFTHGKQGLDLEKSVGDKRLKVSFANEICVIDDDDDLLFTPESNQSDKLASNDNEDDFRKTSSNEDQQFLSSSIGKNEPTSDSDTLKTKSPNCNNLSIDGKDISPTDHQNSGTCRHPEGDDNIISAVASNRIKLKKGLNSKRARSVLNKSMNGSMTVDKSFTFSQALACLHSSSSEHGEEEEENSVCRPSQLFTNSKTDGDKSLVLLKDSSKMKLLNMISSTSHSNESNEDTDTLNYEEVESILDNSAIQSQHEKENNSTRTSSPHQNSILGEEQPYNSDEDLFVPQFDLGFDLDDEDEVIPSPLDGENVESPADGSMNEIIPRSDLGNESRLKTTKSGERGEVMSMLDSTVHDDSDLGLLHELESMRNNFVAKKNQDKDELETGATDFLHPSSNRDSTLNSNTTTNDNVVMCGNNDPDVDNIVSSQISNNGNADNSQTLCTQLPKSNITKRKFINDDDDDETSSPFPPKRMKHRSLNFNFSLDRDAFSNDDEEKTESNNKSSSTSSHSLQATSSTSDEDGRPILRKKSSASSSLSRKMLSLKNNSKYSEMHSTSSKSMGKIMELDSDFEDFDDYHGGQKVSTPVKKDCRRLSDFSSPSSAAVDLTPISPDLGTRRRLRDLASKSKEKNIDHISPLRAGSNKMKRSRISPLRAGYKKRFDGRNKQKRQPFIYDEAVESGDDASSDEDEDSGDSYDESFVDAGTQLTQDDNVDMRAIYLKSVRSPPGGAAGRFSNRKTSAYNKRHDIDIYSQALPEDQGLSEYEEDSFCVDSSEDEYSSSQDVQNKKRVLKKVASGKKRLKVIHASSSDDDEDDNQPLCFTQGTSFGHRKKVAKALESSSGEDHSLVHEKSESINPHTLNETDEIERNKEGSRTIVRNDSGGFVTNDASKSDTDTVAVLEPDCETQDADNVGGNFDLLDLNEWFDNDDDNDMLNDFDADNVSNEVVKVTHHDSTGSNIPKKGACNEPSGHKIIEKSFVDKSKASSDSFGENNIEKLNLVSKKERNIPKNSDKSHNGKLEAEAIEFDHHNKRHEPFVSSENFESLDNNASSSKGNTNRPSFGLSENIKSLENTNTSSSKDSAEDKSLLSKVSCSNSMTVASRLSVSTSSTSKPSPLQILVDSRELSGAQDIISTLRLKHKVVVSVRQLSSCDYVLSNHAAVNRFQWSEFGNCSSRTQLSSRLRSMYAIYQKCVIVIEGNKIKAREKSSKPQNITKYFAKTLSSIIQTGMKIYYTDNAVQTADLLFELCEKESKKGRVITTPPSLNKRQEEMLSFVSSLPRVNMAEALNLAHNFKNVAEISACSVKLLEERGCMPTDKAEFIYTFLRHNFDLQLTSYSFNSSKNSSR